VDSVIFSVQDTGIGMSQEQLDRLFQPFVQADDSTSRSYGGTGLGLMISHRFCEMMGGSVAVKSEVGEGSNFTIVLPINLGDTVGLEKKSEIAVRNDSGSRQDTRRGKN
jgi:signal transduction histidine kinase